MQDLMSAGDRGVPDPLHCYSPQVLQQELSSIKVMMQGRAGRIEVPPPLLCWVTPRKEEDPLVKPGLVRLMAMTSSAMGTVSSRSRSAVYLQARDTRLSRQCQGSLQRLPAIELCVQEAEMQGLRYHSKAPLSVCDDLLPSEVPWTPL